MTKSKFEEKSKSMEKPKSILKVWGEVFSKPSYVIMSFLLAILFYVLSAILANWSNLRWNILSPLILGFHNTLLISSLITTLLISLLFGFLFGLIVYRTKELKLMSDKTGILVTIGIFLGLLAPGCAVCGIGLVSALGLSAVILAVLPFKGLEISVLAIILLGFSIYKISKTISRGFVCGINPKTLHKGERRFKK